MRKISVERKTKETDIRIEINLDGAGRYAIATSIPFLDHMLSLMSKHGLIDLKIKAKGDIEIDDHHTVEDTGIVLKKAAFSAGLPTVTLRHPLTASLIFLTRMPFLISES